MISKFKLRKFCNCFVISKRGRLLSFAIDHILIMTNKLQNCLSIILKFLRNHQSVVSIKDVFKGLEKGSKRKVILTYINV